MAPAVRRIGQFGGGKDEGMSGFQTIDILPEHGERVLIWTKIDNKPFAAYYQATPWEVFVVDRPKGEIQWAYSASFFRPEKLHGWARILQREVQND